jgi:hypothetical protein
VTSTRKSLGRLQPSQVKCRCAGGCGRYRRRPTGRAAEARALASRGNCRSRSDQYSGSCSDSGQVSAANSMSSSGRAVCPSAIVAAICITQREAGQAAVDNGFQVLSTIDSSRRRVRSPTRRGPSGPDVFDFRRLPGHQQVSTVSVDAWSAPQMYPTSAWATGRSTWRMTRVGSALT